MGFAVDFLVVNGFVAIFVLLTWAYGRVLSGGGRLNAFKRRFLIYASIFAAGMSYLMLAVSDLRLRKDLLFPFIAIWGALVGVLAWWRSKRARTRIP